MLMMTAGGQSPSGALVTCSLIPILFKEIVGKWLKLKQALTKTSPENKGSFTPNQVGRIVNIKFAFSFAFNLMHGKVMFTSNKGEIASDILTLPLWKLRSCGFPILPV